MHDRPRVDFKRFQTFGGIIAPLGHQVMPGDHRTVPYIDTGNSICISPVPTEKATEIQAVPVAAVDMSTLGASSTCILGADQLESDPFGFSLVSDKKLTLGVRPAMDGITELSALVDGIFPDAGRKFFHNYASGTNIDSVLDKFLGSNVHQMRSDFRFIVGHSFQEPSGMMGSLGLNLCSSSTDTSATVVQVASGEGESLTVGGVGGGEYPFDARVNSDYTSFGSGFRDGYLMAKNEIPVLTFLAEFGVFPSFDRWNSLVVDFDGMTPEAESFLIGEGKVSLPDDWHNLSPELDWMPSLLGSLRQECGGYASEGRASELGRKTEILPDGIVVLGVKFQGMDLFGRMDNRRNPVAGGKVLSTKLVKLCGLAYLDFDCPDVHNNYSFSKSFEIPSCDSKIVQPKGEVGSLTPTLKMSGFPLTTI